MSHIKENDTVVHKMYGIGTVTYTNNNSKQCHVDFLRGPARICPCKDLKLKRNKQKKIY